MGIGIAKILPFSFAMKEKAHTSNLSISAIVYPVIEEIENYDNICELKDEISRPAAQIYAVNEYCEPRFLTSFLKFQAYIITEKMLNMYGCMNIARKSGCVLGLFRIRKEIKKRKR